jgi:hypothetical protein
MSGGSGRRVSAQRIVKSECPRVTASIGSVPARESAPMLSVAVGERKKNRVVQRLASP